MRCIAKQANATGWLVVMLVTLLLEAAVRLFDLHDSVAAPSATLRALAEGLGSGALSGEIATTLESYAERLAAAIVVGACSGSRLGARGGCTTR